MPESGVSNEDGVRLQLLANVPLDVAVSIIFHCHPHAPSVSNRDRRIFLSLRLQPSASGLHLAGLSRQRQHRRRALLGLAAGTVDMVSLIKCLLRATTTASNKGRTFPALFLVYITLRPRETKREERESREYCVNCSLIRPVSYTH